MNILFEIPDAVIIGIIAVVLLVIIILAFFLKARSRKIKPIGEDERYDSDFLEEEEVMEVKKDDMTDEQLEAKAELEKLYKRMSEDLEKQNTVEDEIEDFERQQEENAIISYQELVKQSEKLKKENEVKEDSKTKKEEPEKVKKVEKKKTPRRTENTKYGQNKNFKSSDIVSPIYGVQSNRDMIKQKNSTNSKKSDIISKAYDEKEFNEEKTQNIDFLNSLKEFRKNL